MAKPEGALWLLGDGRRFPRFGNKVPDGTSCLLGATEQKSATIGGMWMFKSPRIWLVASLSIFVLSLWGCGGGCNSDLCYVTTSVSVRDAAGVAVDDFTATLSAYGENVSINCTLSSRSSSEEIYLGYDPSFDGYREKITLRCSKAERVMKVMSLHRLPQDAHVCIESSAGVYDAVFLPLLVGFSHAGCSRKCENSEIEAVVQ